jgi:hypothetical protein
MKKNDQNRNFGISSKVSASQKAKYIQEAERLNLSLSEWVCGTLDMSINAYSNVNNTEQIEQLQEKNRSYIKTIDSLNRRLQYYKLLYVNNDEQVVVQVEPIVELIEYRRYQHRKLK